MSNRIYEVIKQARVIASDKHPEGFNKSQLIEASKEVTKAASPLFKIKTYDDANTYATYLSDIDGGYPRGMSNCFVVGISGNCGVTCPDFYNGICETPEPQSIEDLVEEYGEEEGLRVAGLYGELEDKLIEYEKENNIKHQE